MAIEAIGRGPYIPPVFSVDHPLKQVEDTKKKVVPFIADTVASFVPLTGPVQEKAETFFGRPKLEEPSIEAFNAAQFRHEMEEVLTHVQAKEEGLDKEQDHNDADIMIMKMMVKCIVAQRQSGHDTETITANEIANARKFLDRLREEHFNIKDDINDRKSTAETIEWINTGLSLGIAATSMAMFLSLGPAGLIAYTIGGLGIAKGLTYGAKGVLEYQNNANIGELYQVNMQQSEMQEQVDLFLNMMMEALQGVCSNWKDQREIFAHRLEASKFN